MPRRLVVIGCGGFGREVLGLVQALQRHGESWAFEGFVDDDPAPENLDLVDRLGARVVGTVADLAGLAERAATSTASDPLRAVIAIGSPTIRSRIVDRLAAVPLDWPTLVHPDTTIGPEVVMGPGTIVAPGARLSTNIRVGAHVHIDQNATVGHDSRIEDLARLNPQACISGSVTIERGALIGASATVLPGLTVGAGAVLGAAACATRDIPAGYTAKGVPAR